MENQNPIEISVEKIIRSKTNKKVPKFIIHLLEKIIHQKEINDFLKTQVGVEGVDFVNAGLDFLDVKIETHGEENIPDTGEFIFASNHPLGGLDGLALASIIGKKFDGKIKFLVNNLLMNLKALNSLFVPINVGGSQNRDINEKIDEIFKSKQQFLVFPAGACSRKIKGKIQDLPWKKTFIVKAQEHQRAVIPIYFKAQNSRFFYLLSNVRKAIGIKFNIELLFLSDEMFKQKGKVFSITFGKPIPFEVFDKTKTQHQWAQYVRKTVYNIP